MTKKTPTKTIKKSNPVEIGAAFLAGAAAATVAGGYFLFGSKRAKENRQKVEAWVVKAKGEVLTKLEKTKELTQEKYEDIIDSVLSKYSTTKTVGKEKAAKLSSELKKHWKAVEKDLTQKEKSAEKKVNSVRKKIARKIEPRK